MDIFGVLTALGGLSLFLYGIYLLSEGLSRMAGGRMARLLERMSDSPGKAALIGAGVTAAVQSSSAVTVMVVGLVDSGMIRLQQAVWIIMGANVGTTATAWILGMTGMHASSVPAALCRPVSFAPVLGMAGVLLLLFSGAEKYKKRALILMGFTILIFGMDMMERAAQPLADEPGFAEMMLRFSNPATGIFAGILLTALLQSSSASIGMLQVLCTAGAMDYRTVVPIILGQNIGTCATALLAGAGAGRNARCAALAHLYFNVIGTVLFAGFFYAADALFRLPFLGRGADGFGIAFVHSAFNLITTFLLLPFSAELVRLACFTADLPRSGRPGILFRR